MGGWILTEHDAEKLFQYWHKSAAYDWKAFLGCKKTKNYVQAMFFLHLYFEKRIKSLIAKSTQTQAPFGHHLAYLAGKLPAEPPKVVLGDFVELSKYKLAARYPDEQLTIYKTITLKFINTWQKKSGKTQPMVGRSTRALIKKVKAILAREQIEYVQLILFGSRAQGFEREDSDIDLCLVADTRSKRQLDQLSSAANIALGLNGVNVDLLVYSRQAFAKPSISPILHQIRVTGIDITES